MAHHKSRKQSWRTAALALIPVVTLLVAPGTSTASFNPATSTTGLQDAVAACVAWDGATQSPAYIAGVQQRLSSDRAASAARANIRWKSLAKALRFLSGLPLTDVAIIDKAAADEASGIVQTSCTALGAAAGRTRTLGSSLATTFPNDQVAFNYFVRQGLTPKQAAGVVGNLDQESGMSPTAAQSPGLGRGIAQWSIGGRWDTSPGDNLVAFAPAGRSLDVASQLDFAWYELTTFPGYGLVSLRNATTISAAVVAFQNQYERCGVCDQATREFYANQVYNAFAGSAQPAQRFVGMASTTNKGYWIAAADGSVFTHGDAPFFGSLGATPPASPIVSIASGPQGGGYWLLSADGSVYSFGVTYYGGRGDLPAAQKGGPFVSITPTRTGNGYWLLASNGGVFSYGDAPFSGVTSLGAGDPAVALAADPDGIGYWIASQKGNVYTHDAAFHGSRGLVPDAQKGGPFVALVATRTGQGYWLGASDGAVYTFGDAPFSGRAQNSGTFVGMASDPDRVGYWLVNGGGAIFSFDAIYYGGQNN